MQIPVILGRECGIAIIGRRAAREPILAKLARGRDDRCLFVVQPECLRIEDRRIQIDLVDIRHVLTGLHRHHAVTFVAAALAFRKDSSAALKALGRSRLARWPTPSSSTYCADRIYAAIFAIIGAGAFLSFEPDSSSVGTTISLSALRWSNPNIDIIVARYV